MQANKDVMGFLNEIQLHYPQAISFASGRPPQQFFEAEMPKIALTHFTKYLHEKGYTEDEVTRELFQYNRTKGFILDLLPPFLEKNEQIIAQTTEIMLTVGAQEAMTLLALGFFAENEVLLMENPAYIGMYEIAKLAKVEIVGVSLTDSGIDLEELQEKIAAIRAKGKKVKALYTIPDFQNPTGTQMPLENRLRLLQLAKEHDFFLMEDNAYNPFYYEKAAKLPTLKALDTNGRVIYIGSFSKQLFPSLRLAVVVATQNIIERLTFVKGYTTVNTPAHTQAILGGLLLQHDFDFSTLLEAKRNHLAQCRNELLKQLAIYFDNKIITWNIPKGGFFLVMTLPFMINEEDVREAAKEYGVIFSSMSYFYLEPNAIGNRQLRLAFSNLEISQIKEGVQRLAKFVKAKI